MRGVGKLGLAVVLGLASLIVGQAGIARADTEHYSLCQARSYLCQDVANSPHAFGEYVGHDEPSVLFYSKTPGSGYNMTYTLRLPRESKLRPTQTGGGTWNFELHPTFWFGLALCDGQSAPNYTHKCVPRSDANDKESADPSSPNYIGKHPGSAFMELQFYGPGWVQQFAGPDCGAHCWIANMTIDSFNANDNTGQQNNADCLNNHFLVGPEPINWAYVTRSGRSQAPANPLFLSGPNGAQGLDPNLGKDLVMHPGDWIKVWIHDTPAGLRVDITDMTSHAHGSMTASTANGFAHVLFQPHATTCHARPGPFHAQYNTAVHRGVEWAAHTYAVAFSDEIGHFEHCNAVYPATGNCTAAGIDDPSGLDQDDIGCLPGSLSSLIKINGCQFPDFDFDGPSYQHDWPGSSANAAVDRRLHAAPITFTSPVANANSHPSNYRQIGFETDLPAIESAIFGHPACDVFTGQNCTNPPMGAAFYPFFSSGPIAGQCVWMEGDRHIQGATSRYGGSSAAEFGTKPLFIPYPAGGFGGPNHTSVEVTTNFRHVLDGNPCKARV